jgi:hypothetical protein
MHHDFFPSKHGSGNIQEYINNLFSFPVQDISFDFSARVVLELSGTMRRRNSGLIFLVVFASFLLATLLVHFFHTEKGIHPDGSCPACHFQTSSLAVGLSLAIILPQLLLVEILPVWESEFESPVVFFDLVSRSPPTA